MRSSSTVTTLEPTIIASKCLELSQATLVDQFRKLGFPSDVIVSKAYLVSRHEHTLFKKVKMLH